MRSISYFPLWVAVLFWMLWGDQRRQKDPNVLFRMTQRITLLEYLRGSLPVPVTGLQLMIVRVLLGWIDGQIRQATRLASALPVLNG